MNQFKRILVSAALAISAFTITFTSCTSDPCKDVVCKNGAPCLDGSCQCLPGFEGDFCQTKTKLKYLGNYKGNGTDDKGGAYTGWTVKVTDADTSSTSKVNIDVYNDLNALQLTFTGTVTPAGIVALDNKTTTLYQYTNGSGVIVANTQMNLTFKESDKTTGLNPFVYTFNSMIKQP